MQIISILLLISVSINCEDSVFIPPDWCPYIKPNGTYKGLAIYRRYRSLEEKESDFVMFNRAGDEWLFKFEYKGKDNYDIHVLNDTLKRNTSEGVLFRFGIYRKRESIGRQYLDCSVKQRVKSLYFVVLIIKLLSIKAIGFSTECKGGYHSLSATVSNTNTIQYK